MKIFNEARGLRVYTTYQGILTRGLLLIMFFSGAWVVSPTFAATTVPTKMNFQGRLANSAGNIMANGTYNMKFRIFNASSGGVQQWSEDRLVSATQGVTVTNGMFSVQLGSITSLPASIFTSNNLYFEVELPTPGTATSSSPVWTEGAMTPRNQLATSAYAYNAETLDGIDGADLAQLGANNTFSGDNTFTGTGSFTGSTVSIAGAANAAKFNVASLFNVDSSSSIVSIGAVDATGTVLVLDTKNTAGDPTGSNGAMYYNSSLNEFRCYANSAWRPCLHSAVGNTSIPGGNTFANSNAENIFASTYTIPAEECTTGRIFRVTARGTYGTALTAPTLALRLKLGATNIIATPTNATTASMSGRQWVLDADIICRAAPSAASPVEGQGQITRSTSAVAGVPWEFSSTAPVNVNTSGALTLQLSAQFNTANASNTITLRQFIVQKMSP